MKTLNRILLIFFIPIFLISCGGGFKLPIPGDDRKTWIRLSVGANIEKLDFVKEII